MAKLGHVARLGAMARQAARCRPHAGCWILGTGHSPCAGSGSPQHTAGWAGEPSAAPFAIVSQPGEPGTESATLARRAVLAKSLLPLASALAPFPRQCVAPLPPRRALATQPCSAPCPQAPHRCSCGDPQAPDRGEPSMQPHLWGSGAPHAQGGLPQDAAAGPGSGAGRVPGPAASREASHRPAALLQGRGWLHRAPAKRVRAWRGLTASGTPHCPCHARGRPSVCLPAGQHAAGTARHRGLRSPRGADGSRPSSGPTAADVSPGSGWSAPGCPEPINHKRFVTSLVASSQPHLPCCVLLRVPAVRKVFTFGWRTAPARRERCLLVHRHRPA